MYCIQAVEKSSAKMAGLPQVIRDKLLLEQNSAMSGTNQISCCVAPKCPAAFPLILFWVSGDVCVEMRAMPPEHTKYLDNMGLKSLASKMPRTVRAYFSMAGLVFNWITQVCAHKTQTLCWGISLSLLQEDIQR